MLLLVLCALTIVLMAAQDTFGTALVVAEGRNLRRFPGLFDAAGDLVSKYGGGVMAASVVKWGLGAWQTAVIVLVTAATSYFATNTATAFANRLLPKGKT